MATDVDISDSDEQPENLSGLTRRRLFGARFYSVGGVEMAFMAKSTGNSFTIGDNDYDIICSCRKASALILTTLKICAYSPDGQFIRLGGRRRYKPW